MITAAEYQVQKEMLLTEYEKIVRNELCSAVGENLAYKIPYFRDGVVNPKVWFTPDNTFRPLFILKEVRIGKTSLLEIPEYWNKWGQQTTFEFAEYRFDDIRVGKYKTWKRVAKLAKGLEDVWKGNAIPDYNQYDFSFQPGEIYKGSIPGYQTGDNSCVTRNNTYTEIMDKIAVIDIKKIGGGDTVNSSLSMATGHYTEHAKGERYKYLRQQIELVNPTVVICCGREAGQCISSLFDNTLKQKNIWLDGMHPAYSSTEKFYYQPLRELKRKL